MISDDSFITTMGALIAMEEMDHIEDCPLLECNAPSERQALPAMTIGQSNVQCNRCAGRGIGSAVLDEEEELCPIASTGPLLKPTQAAECAVDSMAARTGLPILCRSDPRRLVDAPQLQAVLEDLTDPSATIFEGNGNNKEDTIAANVHPQLDMDI